MSCLKFLLVLSLYAASSTAIAQHKGSVKPNWGLADFTKKDESYYLSLDQIHLGWTEAQVIQEFGNKYKTSEYVDLGGVTHKLLRFESYRARMLSDPVDSIVTVDFVNDLVVGAKQVPAPGSDVQANELTSEKSTPKSAPADKLKELSGLLEQGLITQEEYEVKRKEVIDAL